MLLCAPAGTGKTAIGLQLMERFGDGCARAWVGVMHDDDLGHLLNRMVDALEPYDLPWDRDPAELPRLARREGGVQEVAAVLTAVLERFEGTAGLLVIDDLHEMEDPGAFELIAQLVTQLPSRWKLMLISRLEPPLPIARWLLDGLLSEVREETLRFDSQEIRQLSQVLGHSLADDQVEALHRDTQGWVAGVSMFLRLLDNAPGAGVGALDGRRARRRLYEYLAEEVLGRLPEAFSRFLLRCSILPELTASRCAVLTGDASAFRWLHELDRRGLFVYEVQGNEYTLRLHDLFREFLQNELALRHPDELGPLLSRAAQTEPDLARRIGYRLRQGDVDAGQEDLLECAAQVLDSAGAHTLLRLLQRFPPALRSSSPALIYLEGLCAWHAVHYRTMVACMRRAMEGFERQGRLELALNARGLACIGLNHLSQAQEAHALWSQAPASPGEPAGRLIAVYLAFWRSAAFGPWQDTPLHLRRLTELAQQVPHMHWGMLFGSLRLYMGRAGMSVPMTEMVQVLERAAGEDRMHLKTLSVLSRAWLAMWRGDIAAAEQGIQEAVPDCRWLGNPLGLSIALRHLQAVVAHLRGDTGAALRLLKELTDEAVRNPQRRSACLFIGLMGQLAAAAGQWKVAESSLAAFDAAPDKPMEWWGVHVLPSLVLSAELALHHGDPATAVLRLAEHLPRAADADHFGFHARACVTLARAHLRLQQPDAAAQVLAPVIEQAVASAEVLALVLCGTEALHDILPVASCLEHRSAAAQAMLARCIELAAPRAARAAGGSATRADGRTGEPGAVALTERERQVLELVAAGEANKVIARRLGLSPHTVKRHLARLFDKTGLSSRGELGAWHHRNERQSRAA